MTESIAPDIDHLLTYAVSLEEAAQLFTLMGFQLSPISHMETMGISNRMILMRPRTAGRANYIELMSPHDRAKLPAEMIPVLSGPSGIGSMVLGTDSIEPLTKIIADAGFATSPVTRVRREWAIPGEPSVFPEFDVIFPVAAPLRFNVCRYYNVDLYRREAWLNHPNGAQRLSAVFAVAPVPETLRYYAAFLGAPRSSSGGGLCFPVGDVRLEIMTPEQAAIRFGSRATSADEPRYLGYEIEVASMPVLRAQLDAGGVPYRVLSSETLVVDAGVAFGAGIVFTQIVNRSAAAT